MALYCILCSTSASNWDTIQDVVPLCALVPWFVCIQLFDVWVHRRKVCEIEWNEIRKCILNYCQTVSRYNHVLVTFRPGGHFPSHRTIEYVAVLTLRGWRLRTHRIRHNHRILTATRHFMYTLNFTLAHTNATRLRTRRIVREIPTRRTWSIVACANPCLRFSFGRTQEWRCHFASVFTYTINYELFDAAQTRCTATCVALFLPHIRAARLRNTNFYRISASRRRQTQPRIKTEKNVNLIGSNCQYRSMR